MSRKLHTQETPLRYDRAGMMGLLDKIAKGAGSVYDRVMQGLGRKKSPESAFFKPPAQAMAQADHNVGAAEEAEQLLAQQQQEAANAQVLDYLHRQGSTGAGGTLEQGRSYPIRQGGQHSAETSARLTGECSNAGRRLEECKHSGHQRIGSGRGARL